MKKDIQGISGAAIACLRSYSWPGNVRELENAIERAVALERTPAVLPDSLPEDVRAAAGVAPPGTTAQTVEERTLDDGFDLEQHVQDIEREYIMEALRRSNGVKKNAASSCGPASAVPVSAEEVQHPISRVCGSLRCSRFGRDSGLGTRGLGARDSGLSPKPPNPRTCETANPTVSPRNPSCCLPPEVLPVLIPSRTSQSSQQR
jgi:hypothetical protein